MARMDLQWQKVNSSLPSYGPTACVGERFAIDTNAQNEYAMPCARDAFQLYITAYMISLQVLNSVIFASRKLWFY